MGPLVGPHVDELVRSLDQLEGTLENGFGLSDEGDHGAVGFFPGIDIQQLDAGDTAAAASATAL